MLAICRCTPALGLGLGCTPTLGLGLGLGLRQGLGLRFGFGLRSVHTRNLVTRIAWRKLKSVDLCSDVFSTTPNFYPHTSPNRNYNLTHNYFSNSNASANPHPSSYQYRNPYSDQDIEWLGAAITSIRATATNSEATFESKGAIHDLKILETLQKLLSSKVRSVEAVQCFNDLNAAILAAYPDPSCDPNACAPVSHQATLSPKLIDACMTVMQRQERTTQLLPLLSTLSSQVQKCAQTFEPSEFASIMKKLRSVSNEIPESQAMLSALLSKVEESTAVFSIRDISTCLHGLGSMKCTDDYVKRVLSFLASKIDRCDQNVFPPKQMADALCGLRSMSSDVSEVRSILSSLTSLISRCQVRPAGTKDVCRALSGFKYMKSSVAEVRMALAVLLPKILSCRGPMSDEHIHFAVLGLMNMTTDVMEVRQVLAALVPKVKEFLAPIEFPELICETTTVLLKIGSETSSGDNVDLPVEVRDMVDLFMIELSQCNFNEKGVKEFITMMTAVPRRDLRGLARVLGSHIHTCARLSDDTIGFMLNRLQKIVITQSLTSRVSDVCSELSSVLAALVPKIEACEDSASIIHVTNGLKCMSCEVKEVRDVISALLGKAKAQYHDCTPENICAALSLLQYFGCDIPVPEYLDIVETMTKQIETCDAPFDASMLSSAMYGLQGARAEVVPALVNSLTQKIRACPDFGGNDICVTLFGMQQMTSKSHEVYELLDAIIPRIHSCRDWQPKMTSIALFGLQCMHSEDAQVPRVLEAITLKLKTQKRCFDTKRMIMSIYGLKNMDSTRHEVRHLLEALAPMWNHEYLRGGISNEDMCQALDGLKGMSSDLPAVRQLLANLSNEAQANAETSKTVPFSMEQIARITNAFKNKSEKYAEVRDLLLLLRPRITSSIESFQPQETLHRFRGEEIVNALAGLHGLNDEAEVCETLSTLTSRIKFCPDFSFERVAKALHAVQGMSCDVPEVRNLLAALVPKINACVGEHSVSLLSIALYSLQGMRSDVEEVRAVLAALSPVIEASPASVWSGEAIGMGLLGLSSSSSEVEEVRAVLRALLPKIRARGDACNDPGKSGACFTAATVSMALYSLQGMDTGEEVVRAVVSALVPNIRACKDMLSQSQASLAMQGLQGPRMMSDIVEVQEALQALDGKTQGGLGLRSQDSGFTI